MRVLVLGHKGLLGNCVKKYLSLKNELQIITTEYRWPNHDFIQLLKNQSFDWIINCIAQIPQSKPSTSNLFITNLGLPVFLSSLNAKVIHPSTNILDAFTEYSVSKLCAEEVVKNFLNTYIIRCSIIGIEENGNKSLLSWFLSINNETIPGYINHYWNGITTLEWSKICADLIINEKNQRMIVPYSDTITKHDLLHVFQEVFEKNVTVVPVMNDVEIEESRETNTYTGNIKPQLYELKRFYGF